MFNRPLNIVEHFELNTSASKNDAWQSAVTILHTSVWTMLH